MSPMSPAAFIFFCIFIGWILWIIAWESVHYLGSTPLYLFMDKEVKRLAKTLHKLIEENEGELIMEYGLTSRLYTIRISFSRPLTKEEEHYLYHEVNFRPYSYHAPECPKQEKAPKYEIGAGNVKVIGFIQTYNL